LGTILAGLAVFAPAPAAAELTLAPSGTVMQVLNAGGDPDNRAGVHPDRTTQSFELVDTGGETEHARELVIDLPAGMSGDVSATPFCPKAGLTSFTAVASGGECPPETQVGILRSSSGSEEPIFNVKPATNQVVAFGVGQGFFSALFAGSLRPDDFGLSLHLSEIPTGIGLGGGGLPSGTVELWGVPADHQVGTSIPRRALLTTATSCGSVPSSAVSMRTWERPDVWHRQDSQIGLPLVGCESLPFAPNAEFGFDASRADTTSGARIDLSVPQNHDPDGRAASLIKSVNVQMPVGMTFSPGGAERLVSCSDAQLGVGTAVDASCPMASRVGSIEIIASALGGDATQGALYLGQERPGDRFRLFAVANARGTEMKFIGAMKTDPKTGQLTANLSDLPRLPFDAMSLHFDGGPDALLATPLECGPAKAQATFTPYSGSAPVQSSATVSIARPGGGACSGQPPFSPSFSGGSTSAAAGKSTSFRAILTRKDGEQLPARMEIAFPPGMSASLGTVKSCAEADAAKGTCPASSQIGSALAELGPGPDPAQVKGQMFLTGPYKGQPHGMAIAFGGKVGPLDLGTLVVRGSLRVAAGSGRLSAVIDSLPRFFEGISVRFQAIGMQIDRPGFLSNPTSCAPSRLVATSGSVTGQTSRTEVPFKVNGCVNLPFKPRFALALRGRSQLKKGGHPGLAVEVGLAKGANLRQADISLPGPLRLDAGAAKELCARRKATEGKCSRRAQIGTATVLTPLLNEPLKGGVYIAQPKGGGPPDIWTHLEGEGLTLGMQSNTVNEDGKLHTKFTDLPDLPVTKLAIDFMGGKRGLFELKSGLCRQGKARKLRGKVLSVGQNGAQVRASVPVAARPNC
jgi:hypothetical protein